jgi:PPK2 family polyphosphate:nucleotide phosphotransferase
MFGHVERVGEVDAGQPAGVDHIGEQRGGVARVDAGQGEKGVAAGTIPQQRIAQLRGLFEGEPRRGFGKRLRLFQRRGLVGRRRHRGRRGQGRHFSLLCDTFIAVLSKKTLDKFLVTPGKKFKLKDIDPEWRGDGEMKKLSDTELKASAQKVLDENLTRLAEQQARLYAHDRWSVLVVLQAMDAAGKDGMVKHVTSGLNPQGCDVYSFKAPSAEELDHSYLWRIMRVSPARGKITIFNRSHYEEVLVVKVHPEYLKRQKLPEPLITRKIWEERYEDINNFERHLARNGTIILKFFLHISKSEQKKRFIERLENPDKHWKFSAHDLNERQFWSDYMRAYEEALSATSTKWAPWYVIPSDNKSVARVLVSNILTRTIADLNLEYPNVTKEEKLALEEAHKRLLAE